MSLDAHMHFSRFVGAIQINSEDFSEIQYNNSGFLTVFKAKN